MPPWYDLPIGELRGLVAYTKTLGTTDSPPKLTRSEMTTAGTLFVQQRAVCHGPDASGNGPATASLAPTPTNFHEVRPTADYAEAVLARGVRGTAMPKWGSKLTSDERSLLARYVRSFFSKEPGE